MAECHVEGGKLTAGVIEVYVGGFRRSPHRSDRADDNVDVYSVTPRNSTSSYNSVHATCDSVKKEVKSLQGGSCRDERTKVGTSGVMEAGSRCMDGAKGRTSCGTDRLSARYANQNVGLYIGSGKSVGSDGSHPKFGANCNPSTTLDAMSQNLEDCDTKSIHVGNSQSGEFSRKPSKTIPENTLQVGYSYGDITGPKSLKVGDINSASCGSTHSSKGSPHGVGASVCSLKGGGGGHGEAAYNGGSSGLSPTVEAAKGVKVPSVGNMVTNAAGPAYNNMRGIGNIVGIGGATGLVGNSKAFSARAVPSDSQSPPFQNRGALPSKNSGEVSVAGIGSIRGSTNSSPKNSGELNGNGKASITASPRNPSEVGNSGNGSLRASPTPRVPGINSEVGGKVARPTAVSPTRSASTSSISNVGNLLKGNRNGHMLNGVASHGNTGKGNGKLDSANISILNVGSFSHRLTSATGNVSGPGHGVASKGTWKGDASKNGTDVSGTGNADLSCEGALVKGTLSTKDPEEVKVAGNELYRKGYFSEALSLYERAIALSPGQASYRFNKAAALSGLGRLAEAVHECEEAVKLDPFYVRAHQRAASLYLRLGLVESSKRHFQAAGQPIDCGDFQRVEGVKKHISRCIEMKKVGNWKAVIMETDAAVVAGADSAPQVFGYKAEALLRLHKPEEADAILSLAQKVETSLTKLGVTPADSLLFVVQAQIDMALGRFEQAVIASETAARSDRRNVEVSALLKKARAVCHARSLGNELFKAGKFFEACAAYGEGLESDALNSTLLCNRAACRSKLGQWEKAVEDCNAALDVRPDYTKALMRRAECHSKLERWEDALNDYEALLKVVPGDKDVARGLFDVQVAIKKSRGEEIYRMKFGGDVEEVANNDQFQEAVTFPGLVVAQFIARWNEQCKQISPFMNDLCKRYPSVNFIKVDVEESPYLAKTESVNIVPTFKIYKNGMKVKEILQPSKQALEYAVQHYSL